MLQSSITKGIEPRVIISNLLKSFNACGNSSLLYGSGVVDSESAKTGNETKREIKTIRKTITFDFDKENSLLVTGVSGIGKTNLLNNPFLQKLQFLHEPL